MSKFKVLELFAGSRSIGKICEELGYKVFSSDINAFEKIDYVVSILDFDIKQLPFIPDIVWASPPCTTYSVLALSHHRNGIWPKSESAVLGDRITEKTNSIIKELQKLNPDLAYYIENPRGMMRHMPFMKEHPIRRTITYCQYGFNYQKPTDIWTNNILWKPSNGRLEKRMVPRQRSSTTPRASQWIHHEASGTHCRSIHRSLLHSFLARGFSVRL